MKTILKLSKNALLISGLLLIASFGDPKAKAKYGGRCTGSKYCKACKNCSRCAHCGAGGVCGVCSPESFEEKPAPVQKKKVVENKKDTLKNNHLKKHNP